MSDIQPTNTNTESEESKYDKNKKVPLPSKDKIITAEADNLIWLKLELTRFFGMFALFLICIGRVLASKENIMPFAAPLIFPMISLQIHSRFVRLALTLVTQIYCCKLIYPGFGE